MTDERRAEFAAGNPAADGADSQYEPEYDGGVDSTFDSDATVVRPTFAGASVSIEADDDATVVRPRPTETRPDRRGDPVPDPELSAAAAAQTAAAQGVAAPDSAGASARSGVPRRAANLMPRVYGPRPVATAVAPEPEATAAGVVAATNPCAQLPSLARRDRRLNIITLAGYALSVCVAGVGLWFIATLVFAG